MLSRYSSASTAIQALRQVIEALSLEADFEAFFRKAAGRRQIWSAPMRRP